MVKKFEVGKCYELQPGCVIKVVTFDNESLFGEIIRAYRGAGNIHYSKDSRLPINIKYEDDLVKEVPESRFNELLVKAASYLTQQVTQKQRINIFYNDAAAKVTIHKKEFVVEDTVKDRSFTIHNASLDSINKLAQDYIQFGYEVYYSPDMIIENLKPFEPLK